jgi:hypothetical protein
VEAPGFAAGLAAAFLAGALLAFFAVFAVFLAAFFVVVAAFLAGALCLVAAGVVLDWDHAGTVRLSAIIIANAIFINFFIVEPPSPQTSISKQIEIQTGRHNESVMISSCYRCDRK